MFQPTRLFPGSRRCSTQISSKQQFVSQKSKLHRLKRTSPFTSSKHHSLLLPQLKSNNNISTRNSSSKQLSANNHSKSRSKYNPPQSKLSNLISLPDNLLIIKEQEQTIPLSLMNLLKEFNERKKSLNYIAQLSLQLREYNTLFRKLCQVISCCIIRNSTVKFFQKSSYIYNKNDQSHQFYIILEGKILLHNKKDLFKKICKSGQTISQQIIIKTQQQIPEHFNTNITITPPINIIKEKLEYAKCLTDVIVLEVRAVLYQRLCMEASMRGQKHNVSTLESLMMRNYLNKMSLRRKEQTAAKHSAFNQRFMKPWLASISTRKLPIFYSQTLRSIPHPSTTTNPSRPNPHRPLTPHSPSTLSLTMKPQQSIFDLGCKKYDSRYKQKMFIQVMKQLAQLSKIYINQTNINQLKHLARKCTTYFQINNLNNQLKAQNPNLDKIIKRFKIANVPERVFDSKNKYPHYKMRQSLSLSEIKWSLFNRNQIKRKGTNGGK